MSELTIHGSASGHEEGQNLESFGNLVEKNLDAVYALAFAGLGNRDSAEDLACDVFLRAWLHRNHPERSYPSSVWLTRLVRELAREWAGTGQIRSPLLGLLRLGPPAGESSDRLSAQEKLAANQARQQLERQVRLLAVPAREVVMLRSVAGQSSENVARLLGLSSSAVESLLREAKAVFEAQPKVAGSPARLLGPGEGLVRRTLDALDAAEAATDSAREVLFRTASIDHLLTKGGKRAGDALAKGLASLGGILLFPLRLVFVSLYALLGGRGTGLLLAMLFLGAMTFYIAWLMDAIPPGMVPFMGPRPPAIVLQMRPFRYGGTVHRQNVDRRSLLAEAAHEASGQLVAYIPKDYGVLIAVRWNDGRTRLTGAFTGRADVIGVASIQQDPESLSLARRSPDRLDHPYTAWFLVTY